MLQTSLNLKTLQIKFIVLTFSLSVLANGKNKDFPLEKKQTKKPFSSAKTADYLGL